MKRLFAIGTALVVAVSCYPDYVTDYDTSAAYIAYQYDLRTFVAGEGMKFDVTVGLAGVMSNGRDRAVRLEMDDALVTGDLSGFGPAGTASFNAYKGMLGTAPVGVLSQGYVTTAVNAAGAGVLSPLPARYYTVDGLDGLSIAKGRHTAVVTVRADSLAMTSDPNAYRAVYALGFHLVEADVDTIPRSRSYAVIAVRCENRFFGNWYHGGITRVVDDATGEVLSTRTYATPFPQPEDQLYVLTTRTALSVTAVRAGGGTDPLTLTFDGDRVTVTGEKDIRPHGEGSRFNGARLLQDRKIFLNYRYANGDGTSTVVTDTLAFRNRVRDGINEWQDENPENYR